MVIAATHEYFIAVASACARSAISLRQHTPPLGHVPGSTVPKQFSGAEHELPTGQLKRNVTGVGVGVGVSVGIGVAVGVGVRSSGRGVMNGFFTNEQVVLQVPLTHEQPIGRLTTGNV